MTKDFFKSFKFLILMLFLLSVWGLLSCEKKVDLGGSAQTSNCGVGSGNYYFYEVTSLPENFDCNTAGSFSIELKPEIDPSYTGFNRLYFELEKDWTVYRSNYVELYSGNYATQQLEFGGSLPTGTYEATAYLQNIQLNSTCEDSVYLISSCWLGNIDITQFSSPQKMMNIEYFCQYSDTGIISSYDVFLSPNTAEYVYNAFRIANTDRTWYSYQTNLTPQLLKFTDDDFSEIVDYISNLKQSRDKMFLCGIKGFKDDQGNLLDYLGITALSDTINFTPSDSSGSLVAVKACINYAGTEYKVDFNDLVTSTTVHELGHQRAILHHEGHSKFCRMNAHPIYPGDRSTYLNPHFCNSCINKIKNINW